MKRLNLSGKAEEIRYQEIFDWKGTYADSISVTDSMRRALTILHAGLLAMDPETGAIKAWVGGIDFKTQPYDQILARRQLASVFKPVLYAAALEEGMEPCQYLDNDSVTLAGIEDWSPENFDHSFGGKYSLAGALAQSMNIPTFSLYLKIGFEKLDSMWKKMGFSFTLDNTPSLPMGTAEASIKEVAVAYSAFANGGYRISPDCISSIKTLKEKVIYSNDIQRRKNKDYVRQIMYTDECNAAESQSGRNRSIDEQCLWCNIPLAGKTGTSQNYADAWFAAFNPKLIIVSQGRGLIAGNSFQQRIKWFGKCSGIASGCIDTEKSNAES